MKQNTFYSQLSCDKSINQSIGVYAQRTMVDQKQPFTLHNLALQGTAGLSHHEIWKTFNKRREIEWHLKRSAHYNFFLRKCSASWLSGYCYLNKRECNLNQSKDDSFVGRVAKNNN